MTVADFASLAQAEGVEPVELLCRFMRDFEHLGGVSFESEAEFAKCFHWDLALTVQVANNADL